MPTNDRLSLNVAPAWLRAQVDRLRRSMMAQRPAVRWSLALVVLLGLGTAVYWVATSWSTLGVRYLVSARRLYSDDLIMVCRALDKQRIDYRVDDHRVEVAADQYDQAAELVAKLNLGQRTIDEIRTESSTFSILEGRDEREQKKQLSREKIIEQLIGRLDGVVWSLVSIHHPHSSAWMRTASRPTAFVYIETEGKRQLPYQTVQSIPAILTGCEPELTLESITVMDRRGKSYLEPGNPALGDNSRNRAREEELVEDILENLYWIKGVRVQVKVMTPRATKPVLAMAGATSKQPGAAENSAAIRPADGTIAAHSGGIAPAIGVNQPLELEPEPESATKLLPAPKAASVAASGIAANPIVGGHRGDREHQHQHERGRVLIHVPRSFYINGDTRTDSREPSREELRVMADRTEKQIRTAVGLVIPESESWKVDVDTIADEISLSRPVILPSSADARRRVLDWGIVGAVGAAVSILAAVGSWIQVARRPARPPEPALKTWRYHADSASEPGPSERVRELVRRNPEAAASVLQRWTGQGGRVS
jgi:hypothetical protein